MEELFGECSIIFMHHYYNDTQEILNINKSKLMKFYNFTLTQSISDINRMTYDYLTLRFPVNTDGFSVFIAEKMKIKKIILNGSFHSTEIGYTEMQNCLIEAIDIINDDTYEIILKGV